MTVLIIFATIEGQTAKIARFAEETVQKAGHDVRLFDANDRMAPLSFDGVTHVILAAPVHERRHPQNFEVLLSANHDELTARKSLFLSVSLNAAFKDMQEEAQEYVTETEMRTRFKADQSVLVAGAIKTGSYDYFATQVLRYNLLSGREYDPADGDREFTDWEALRDQITAFLSTE